MVGDGRILSTNALTSQIIIPNVVLTFLYISDSCLSAYAGNEKVSWNEKVSCDREGPPPASALQRLSKSHPGTEPAGIVLGELPAPSMKPPLLVDNLAAAGATGRQELVWCPHCRSCNSSRSTTVPVSVAGVRIRATSLRWRLTWGRSSAVAIVIEMSAAGPCRCNSAEFPLQLKEDLIFSACPLTLHTLVSDLELWQNFLCVYHTLTM